MSSTELAARIESLEATYKDLQTMLNRACAEVDHLKGQLGSTRAINGELRNEVESCRARIEALEARPENRDGARRSKLGKALKANPPRFDGKDDNFRTWLVEYKSFARKHGFLFALEESANVPIGSSMSDAQLVGEGYDHDLVTAARDAFFSLREACNDTTYRATVANATSAPEMLQMLTEYYQGNTDTQWCVLQQQFTNSLLKKDQNPVSLHVDLHRIADKLGELGEKPGPKAIRKKFLDSLPESYATTKALIRDKPQLGRHAVDSMVRERFEELQKEKSQRAPKAHAAESKPPAKKGRKQETPKQNNATGTKKAFYKACKRSGHSENDCPNCARCGGHGHKEDQCGTPSTPAAHVAAPREESPEPAVVAHTSRSKRGQYEPELWIGDSGATHHLTGSSEGMYDFRPTAGKEVQTPAGMTALAGYGKLRVRFKNDVGKTVSIV